MRTRRGNGIRVHTQYLHIRQCLAQMLLELLRTGAELVEQAAAFGTGIVERSRIAAVMADEPPGDAVPREIHAAMRTTVGIAALTAGDKACRAAAVQKQDALLAAGNIFPQFVQQHTAYFAAVSAAKLLPHIYDADGWQLTGVEAVFQGKQMIHALFGAVTAFHIRRRAAENQKCIGGCASELGGVAGVVARGIFGFVGILLLLIHDDKPKIAARGEDGASRSDHNARFSGLDALPLIVALANGERAVEYRDVISEVRGENADHLRRERDLRHEQDGRLPFSAHGVDQMNVHGCLAASGDAIEERRRCMLAVVQR